MAKRLLLRDAENISQDILQRLLGVEFWPLPVVGGVGTGFAAGGVGQKPTASTGHLAVTANGTTMQMTILPGWAVTVRDAGGSTYDPRCLFAESDANDSSVTITSNSTGSTRNDTVCLKIDQNTAPTSDGSNLVSFVALAGASGGALPNAPTDGNLYLPIANIAVANGATSIAQGNVTDLRQGILNPGGALLNGYAQVIANQGPFTALTDLTGLAVTVIVAASRRIRVSGFVLLQSTVASDVVTLSLREGAATLIQAQSPTPTTAATNIDVDAQVVLAPTAGSHTYKLSAQRAAGTGNITMFAGTQNPSWILVEDLGPVH